MRTGPAIGALFLVGAIAVGAAGPQETDRKTMEQVVTPHSDLAGLAEITTIPGQPAVLWARLPIGRIDQTGRVPGPTDLVLLAVLTYGTAHEAEAVLGDAAGEAAVVDVAIEWIRYNWFPRDVLDTVSDGKLAVIRYGALDQFGGSQVSRVEGAPNILLLRKILL